MFHATYLMILTCFRYILCHFYTFSGTNLLTRCRSASSCFLPVFAFRNPGKEIFSERDETFSKSLKILRSFQRREDPKLRSHVGSIQQAGAAQGGPAPPCCVAPSRRLLPWFFRLFIPRDAKLSIRRTRNTRTHQKPPPSPIPSRGIQEITSGTLPERGFISRRALHRHDHLRIDVWVVHLGPWIHSSS